MSHKSPLSSCVRLLSFVGGLLLLACFLVSPAFGQAATATLSGTVQDQNGAVIAGAAVTVLNSGTALERHATTTDEGYFTIPLLPPGTYSVSARRDGFSPVEFKNVVLNVGDQKALQIQLKAGDVNATVTVSSDVGTVRTDGSVGTVVNRQQVASMPLNGRSLHALIQLTPGVVLTPALSSGSATGTGQFSVNGQRTTSNYYMVDGVSANVGVVANGAADQGVAGSGQTPGTTALGGTNSLVSLDALQEFRIETSTFAPEFGRTPGGQISLVTRAGTNQFHGSAAYYFRNESLDANDWFANATRQPKPKERQNLFSGVLGGPLFLPRLGEGGHTLYSGRNRVFFFASYEGLRLQQPNVAVVTVPTVALRAQAISALRPYLNALPLPNGQDFGDGTARFTGSYSDPGTFNIFGLRFDGRITNAVSAFFRFNHAPSESKTRVPSLSQVSSVRAVNSSYSGGLTWVATSRLTADARLNWTRNQALVFAEPDTFGGAVIPQVADVFAPGRDPSTAKSIFRSPGGGSWGWGPGTSDVQRQFNVIGTVAWLVGSHELKFGADYRRLLPIVGATGLEVETLLVTAAAQVANSRPLLYQIANSDPVPREPTISNLSLYTQDSWHATRRLTLIYGLRFERIPSPGEATGRLPRTVLGIEGGVLHNPRLAPQGTPLFQNRFGEFAPRFGVAYQLSGRTGWEATVRGGTGVFYDLGLGEVASAFEFQYPFVASKLVCCNIAFPISAADRTPPTPGVDPPGTLTVLDPTIRMPYTIEWNATLEQGLGAAQTLTISYVGASGHRLLAAQGYTVQLLESPNVDTSLRTQGNLGRSSYRALQVQYQRRLTKGLQALASYTLARSKDNASTDSSTTPPPSLAALITGEWGTSDFDVRHVLSAAVTYDLPKFSGPILPRALLNNWSLDLLVRYQSAFPVNPVARFAPFVQRPDLVPGQPLYVFDPAVPGGRRFNKAAFLSPAPNQQGNFPRNGLRAFPASQVDLALQREFKLGEPARLQLRAEFFNLFNHPNFGLPVNDVRNGLFGQPTQMLNRGLGGLNALYQMGGPRSGQLAVKVVF